MTLFRALYGYDALQLIRYEAGSTANSWLEQQLHAQDALLDELKGHSLQAQHFYEHDGQ